MEKKGQNNNGEWEDMFMVQTSFDNVTPLDDVRQRSSTRLKVFYSLTEKSFHLNITDKILSWDRIATEIALISIVKDDLQ